MKEFAEKIVEVLEEMDFCFYGLRKDDYSYAVGDTCNNSRQLFQDAETDDDGKLVYPRIENGINKGFYDGGELDGTCAISISRNATVADVLNILESAKMYHGENIYLIAGDDCQGGNDVGEIVINSAVVMAKF
ncbi:MAG: hypothetical protein PHG19_04160 [Anaerotignum sp.]|nr:hypothetical protein [Anaerotignum sp.]